MSGDGDGTRHLMSGMMRGQLQGGHIVDRQQQTATTTAMATAMETTMKTMTMTTHRVGGILEDADLPPRPPFNWAHCDHRDGRGHRGESLVRQMTMVTMAGSDADDRDADDDGMDH